MIEFKPVKVETGSADEDGRLVLHDGRLIAVLVRLEDPDHGPAVGQWSLEAGFNGIDSPKPPLFANLAAAERWLGLQISRVIAV